MIACRGWRATERVCTYGGSVARRSVWVPLLVCLAVSLAVYAALTARTAQPIEGRPGFVYRNGETLMLDGAPYRFVGVNNYDLTGAHTGRPASLSDAEAFFAQLQPNTMVRVWAFEEWGIDAPTQLVKLAEKYRQKLVFTLADGSGKSGRAPKFTNPWYQGGYTNAFYDAAWGRNINYWEWVTKIVSLFKDSPAVGFWEIMNEPGSSVDDLTPTAIKRFYDAAAAHIKQADPSHLVSTGALGAWQTFQHDAAGYEQVHSGPDIDLISVHEYDYPYTDGETLGSPWFDAASQAARALGKPVYVGETGISLASGCMSAADRADALRRKFDEYLHSGAAGVLYWAVLGPPNNPGPVCDTQYGNNDPMLGGAIMDMIMQYRYSPAA